MREASGLDVGMVLAWLGTRSVWGRAAPVTMETAPCRANHRSAPARSYVCPSAATTGSRITCHATPRRQVRLQSSRAGGRAAAKFRARAGPRPARARMSCWWVS